MPIACMFYLNVVGYKAGSEGIGLSTLDVFYLNVVGYKGDVLRLDWFRCAQKFYLNVVGYKGDFGVGMF